MLCTKHPQINLKFPRKQTKASGKKPRDLLRSSDYNPGWVQTQKCSFVSHANLQPEEAFYLSSFPLRLTRDIHHTTLPEPPRAASPAIDVALVYNTPRFDGGRMHLTSKTCIFCNQNPQLLLQNLDLADGKNHMAGSLAVARAEVATLSPSSSSKRAEIAKKQPKGAAGEMLFQLEIALIFSGRESPYCP